MSTAKRTIFDKFKATFLEKDLHITSGEIYTDVRKYDFSTYCPADKYIHQQNINNENVYNIKNYGALIDNVDNSQSINLAIKEAAKTKGTVLVSGGTFCTKQIYLESDVTLFIDSNSALSSNLSGQGYPELSIIYAKDKKNIHITGGGKIIGNGNYFGFKPLLDENTIEPDDYIDVIEMRKKYRACIRFKHPSKYGGIAKFDNCENIKIDNIKFENSASWTLTILNCTNIFIGNFLINNNRCVANTDGIDIVASRNVYVNNSFISTADDGICLKNAIWLNSVGVTENVNISNCEIISRTNAIKIGTETTYDISKVNIENCKLFMTDLYPGSVSAISIESCDGSIVSDINIQNITTDRCTCPLFIRVGNRNRTKVYSNKCLDKYTNKGKRLIYKYFNARSEIKNINVNNMISTNIEIPIVIAGYRQGCKTHRITNITLKNISLSYVDRPERIDRRLYIPEYVKVYPENWRFKNLPSYAIWSRHTENLITSNFKCEHPLETWKKDIIIRDNIAK